MGSDSGMWFTESSGNKIGRYTFTATPFTEFPIPTANSVPTGIAPGPDGTAVVYREQRQQYRTHHN